MLVQAAASDERHGTLHLQQHVLYAVLGGSAYNAWLALVTGAVCAVENDMGIVGKRVL
jgi:hypothetical protein